MDDNYFEVEESTPLLPEQQRVDDLPSINLEPEGPRAPAQRKHVTQLGLVLVAIVVVVVTFHSLVTPSTPAPAAATPEPTTPPPSTLISSNINFGTISINGRQQRGTIPMFFRPPDGSYTITINAPPFRPKSCTFIFANGAPQNDLGSTICEVGNGSYPTITANGITDAPGYLVGITFTATDLPPDQQNQINALLIHSISEQQTTTAPAGSYIATGLKVDNIVTTITSRRITAPLKATASLAASTNFGQFGPPCDGLICPLFGFDPEQFTNFTGMVWGVGVPVAIRWRFTTSAGHAMGDVSFSVADISLTLLAYTPDAGWSLSSQSPFAPFNIEQDVGNTDCNTGSILLQQQLQGTSAGFNISTPKGIEGCLMTAQDTSGSSLGSFIWRFGVLLATDSKAHKLLPSLPVAPPAEIAAVKG